MDEKEKIITIITEHVKKYGKLPTYQTLKDNEISEYKIKKHFQSLNNVKNCIAKEVFDEGRRTRIIADLRKKLTPPDLSFNAYKKRHGNYNNVYRYFSNWTEAIAIAFPENINEWKIARYGKNNAFIKSKQYKLSDADFTLLQLPRPSRNESYSLLSVVEEVEQYYLRHNCRITVEELTNYNYSLYDAIYSLGGWKKIKALTRIPEYEKAKTLAKFKQEASEIIKENGYFSMKLHKAKPGTLHHTKLRDMFGSLAQLRIEAGLDVPKECYTSRTWAYTDKEYSDFLWKIYNKYGFISKSLIDNEPNHIARDCIVKHFGNIEAACKHFGIPYKAPAHRSKFYFEIETKACNYLQLPCVQEKTWPWLKYKSRLRCDLFFPLLNLVIEIDGPQHYKNFRFFNESDEKYYTALKRDQIKNEELPKHGIDLIRINSENVKQIEEILRPFRQKRDLIYALCAF